jgi:translation initiation factor 3 subunit M
VVPALEVPSLTLKAIRAAISIPSIFDFYGLASLPCIKQFQAEKNPAYDFIQIFIQGDLASYRAFVKNHSTWLSENGTCQDTCANADIDEAKAERKARLMTVASLANTPSRTLSYSTISSTLEIPPEDVELWLIDVIRAGLVEGKLSQARQELLVHRTTCRAFGREQWEELDSRLEQWKVAIENVLASDQVATLKEQEKQEGVVNGTVGKPST